jgi:hypothetical protein
MPQEKSVTETFKYTDIFEDHMRIAKETFIKENGREPTLDELLRALHLLNYYYFD